MVKKQATKGTVGLREELADTEVIAAIAEVNPSNRVTLIAFIFLLLTIVSLLITGSETAIAAESVDIERKGEGRHFYRTIKIPAGAETLYLSGSGASSKDDGTMGSMEEQTRNTFQSFKATLEEEGWSMSDVVQVRAFAVAGDDGELDFNGFNVAYREFFGTDDNPMKPVRSFVQIAGLVVPGWLVEIEIRAAKVP